MNQEQIALFTRILNAQESQIELITALQMRVSQLEQASAIRDQLLTLARDCAQGHQSAIEQIGEAFGDLNQKLQALNSNDRTLQDELRRQREELGRVSTGGRQLLAAC